MLEIVTSLLEGSRGFLPTLLPLSFTISFLLAIIFFALDYSEIKKYFKIRLSVWVILIFIFLLALSLRLITPVYLTTYGDEFAHVQVARDIITSGRAVFNEPVGFSYVVALFLLFGGINENSAYMVNIVTGSLLVVVVFLFCFLLFKSEKTGLYSAFIVSIIPLYILLSRNIEPDTVSAFFILLTFTAFLLFFKIRDLKIGIFATSILAFSISIKQEDILLIPLVLLLSVLFLDAKTLKSAIKNKRLWFLVLLLTILVIPHILHLSLEIYPALYGKSTATVVEGKLIRMENIPMNAQVLAKAMNGSFYPLLINVFLFAGLLYGFKKHRKEALFLAIFFSCYMFAYLAYSASIVEKYLITGLVPLLCFAGLGFYAFEEFALSMPHKIARQKVITKIVPTFFVLLLFLLSIPYFYAVQNDPKPLNVNHGYPRGEIEYKEMEVIDMIDREIDSCYVVTKEPVFFSATDLKAIPTESVLKQPEMLQDVTGNRGCVFYFKDLYCTDFYSLGNRCGIENESFETCEELRRKIVSQCREMHEKFELQPYLEYEFGDFNLTLYKITTSS